MESPPEDDFMQMIMRENNKNTYRWEAPQQNKKSDPIFPDLVVEEDDEELEKIQEKARKALGREDEEQQPQELPNAESYIDRIKNARPLEFDSVQEDYEAENQSSFEEQMDFQQPVEEPVEEPVDNFALLKS